MANLHFYYGVMGSSKSAKLIIEAYNLRKNGNQVEIIKPAFDTRFSTTQVKSRAGHLSVDAVAVPNLTDYKLKPGTQFLLVDEVQFFMPSDIDKMVYFADEKDIHVFCYGLKVDSNGHLFPAAQRLFEVSATPHQLESNCQINGCMHRATHHLRFDSAGNVIHEGEQFALGDSNYKSVCRWHFNQIYNGK